MKTLSFEKIITVINDKNKTVYTIKHGELHNEIINDGIITVTYRYGDLKRRIKQLEALGFKKSEEIYFDNESITAKIKEIWTKKEVDEK